MPPLTPPFSHFHFATPPPLLMPFTSLLTLFSIIADAFSTLLPLSLRCHYIAAAIDAADIVQPLSFLDFHFITPPRHYFADISSLARYR
jgi:hypothetical protein